MQTFWLWPVGVVVGVAAIALVVRLLRRPPQPAPVLNAASGREADPAAALFAGGNRPTEDDIAQARLGGLRGAPQLGAAPLVRQVADNTLPPVDPGHVV